MKKLILWILTISMILSVGQAVLAKTDTDVVVALELGNPIMLVNGKGVEIDEGRGTAPLAIDGRTLVPIRAIIEAFGGSARWIPENNEVVLTIGTDAISLVIDSRVAFFNNGMHVLDVAPRAINGRTMLPVRFIAESFNLGVAWDGAKNTVYVVRDRLTDEEYERITALVPEYAGEAYAVINDNEPFFLDYEIIGGSFEYYSTNDELGRCNVCVSSIAEDIMPDGERGSISSVKPTGWINKKYDNVPGGYLYNRCHLIGYQLTGENANKRNLITGTRYMNTDGMLPIENMVDDYIEKTGNRVMYRVTPVFNGNNLVADGVLIEAYSVEDSGEGISICVYCYNVQPGIVIDYKTGESVLK